MCKVSPPYHRGPVKHEALSSFLMWVLAISLNLYFYQTVCRTQRRSFCSAPGKMLKASAVLFIRNSFSFSCPDLVQHFQPKPIPPSFQRQLVALCVKCHFMHENKSRVSGSGCCQTLCYCVVSVCKNCKRQSLLFMLTALFVALCNCVD